MRAASWLPRSAPAQQQCPFLHWHLCSYAPCFLRPLMTLCVILMAKGKCKRGNASTVGQPARFYSKQSLSWLLKAPPPELPPPMTRTLLPSKAFGDRYECACIMVPSKFPFSSGHKGSQWCPQATITDPYCLSCTLPESTSCRHRAAQPFAQPSSEADPAEA